MPVKIQLNCQSFVRCFHFTWQSIITIAQMINLTFSSQFPVELKTKWQQKQQLYYNLQ